MPMQIIPSQWGEAFAGIGSALQSALQKRGDRAFKREEKETEFKQKRDVEEAGRLRQAQSGTILQKVLSEVGPNPSLTDLGTAFSSYIEQGGDPEVGKQVFSQFAPGIKEQARTEGAQSFLQQLTGGLPPGPLQGVVGQEGVSPQSGVPSPELGGQPQAAQQAPSQAEGFSGLSESQLVMASGAPYPEIANMAKTELQRRDLDQKRFESQRKYEGELSTPFLKKVDESRDAVREKEGALDLMSTAFEEGNLDFFSKDNFANFLGRYGEGLRSPEGALVLNATKEFLLGNIQRAGARPNQWIEQQISLMLPKIGRSKDANLSIIEALRAETEMQRKKIQVTDGLAEQYRGTLGYVPSNIGSLVDKEMQPYADEIQSRLAYKLRELHESDRGERELTKNVSKKVSSGTPLTVGNAREMVKKYGTVEQALKNAGKLGYTIPTMEDWKRWQ